ncbi:hypothetical protein [Gemmatimonas sp. UBA7669]|uniref:hypothetical protein n=1 Tax=Gemmatimonas sp. UBA7669 TaxID=1946568 RepID=UPI0025C260A0|nr:hypothetical protein [Gemmatimonas sp. UBA7669]
MAGTDREVVIATTLVAPLTADGNTPYRTHPWVLLGNLGNWTVQGPANSPGLNPRQIAGADGLEFIASAMTGATASWGDRVVLLPRGIWWRPGATTDQSFLSLTSAASGSWQLFAQRGYPWGVDSFQWMTGAAGTPWEFFAVGHVGFQTAFWFSADGHRWDVVPDPVRHVWVSRDAQRWVRIPEGPTFTKIIGLDSRLWGFRAGAVWELDISSVRE